MKTLKRVLTAPLRLVRKVRYDPEPYGSDTKQTSGEDAMRQGQVNQSFQTPG